MKVMKIQHRKEREKRTIQIERCGQCPYSMPMYELGQDRTFACYDPWMPMFHVDITDRIVDINGEIQEWCVERDYKEGCHDMDTGCDCGNRGAYVLDSNKPRYQRRR